MHTKHTRTHSRPWSRHYVSYNLRAMTRAGLLAKHAGVDIFSLPKFKKAAYWPLLYLMAKKWPRPSSEPYVSLSTKMIPKTYRRLNISLPSLFSVCMCVRVCLLPAQVLEGCVLAPPLPHVEEVAQVFKRAVRLCVSPAPNVCVSVSVHVWVVCAHSAGANPPGPDHCPYAR